MRNNCGRQTAENEADFTNLVQQKHALKQVLIKEFDEQAETGVACLPQPVAQGLYSARVMRQIQVLRVS
jgi:hypothetical protein